jgi:hypothetical protein
VVAGAHETQGKQQSYASENRSARERDYRFQRPTASSRHRLITKEQQMNMLRKLACSAESLWASRKPAMKLSCRPTGD